MRSACGTKNPSAVVSEVLQALRLDGDQAVELDGTAKPLREWLATGRELTRLTRPFLTQQAERSKDARLADVLQPGHEADLRRTLKDLQVVDVLQRHPGEWDAKSFVQALRPLAPRLYSIASSQEAVARKRTSPSRWSTTNWTASGRVARPRRFSPACKATRRGRGSSSNRMNASAFRPTRHAT